MSEPVFQSSLGAVDANSNRGEKTWNDGSLDAAAVTKMHHKRATADCAIFGGPNEIRSMDDQEGQNAPVVASRYAGYDKEYNRPYGEFMPLQVGDRPVIIYAKNDKSKPIIVGVMHNSDEEVGDMNVGNILPPEYPVDPHDKRESLRQIWVHRSQDGFTIDGENGEFEISSHTKSFIRSCSSNQDEETFDYEDLVLKDKRSLDAGDPKTIYLPERYSYPLKYMAVFRSKYEDSETDYLRFCVDASKVVFKWMQQKPNDDKLTFAELKEDGTIRLRRQTDAVERDSGEKHTEAQICEDGTAKIERIGWDADSVCELREDGAYIDVDQGNVKGEFAKEHILLKIGNAEIRMTEDKIVINAPTVHIN